MAPRLGFESYSEYSGKDLSYEAILLDCGNFRRSGQNILFLLMDAYTEDDKRIYLKLNPKIAPYKIAVFPLVRNKEEITKRAWKIYQDLKTKYMTVWDDREILVKDIMPRMK